MEYLSLHPFPNLSFLFLPFILRSSFAFPSFFLRSSYSRRNGFTADLQRNYNGLAYERENALAIFQ